MEFTIASHGDLGPFGADLPGAVPDLDREGIAGHYGDPAAEQRALAAGWAAVDLSDMDIVTVAGPDRKTWLTTLSTQVIHDIVPTQAGVMPEAGASKELLLLDFNGHIEHAAAVIDDGAQTWLVTDPGRGEALVAKLRAMQFALRVEVVDRSAEFAVLGFAGGGGGGGREAGGCGDGGREAGGAGGREAGGREGGPVAASVRENGGLIWADPWPGVVPGGTSYSNYAQARVGLEPIVACYLAVVAREPGMLSRVVARAREIAASSGMEQVVTETGYPVGPVRAAGLFAWEAIRVANWRPRIGAEVDHRSLPHELDWLRSAVHLAKGCYCGQEAVARIVNLGRPPRRIVQLDFDPDGEGAAVGAAIVVRAGERVKEIGKVTSVARHCELGLIGLGVVTRSYPAGSVEVGGEPVVVTAIVDPEGRAAASPAQRPGAGLKRIAMRPGASDQKEE